MGIKWGELVWWDSWMRLVWKWGERGVRLGLISSMRMEWKVGWEGKERGVRG